MSKFVGFQLGKVHESHVISEYYCGGCGWPITDHDSFCPECGGAFRECDASNLEDENAKLRELLIDAYKDMDAWQMVIANSDQWGYGKGCLERLCKMREAMCELGIEAD